MPLEVIHYWPEEPDRLPQAAFVNAQKKKAAIVTDHSTDPKKIITVGCPSEGIGLIHIGHMEGVDSTDDAQQPTKEQQKQFFEDAEQLHVVAGETMQLSYKTSAGQIAKLIVRNLGDTFDPLRN